MSRSTRLALPVLAGALFLLLAMSWLLPEPAAAPSHMPATPPAATADAAAAAAVSQWGGTALARPLFNPGRRPLDQPGAMADGSLPRLSAIIISGGTRAAVFADDGQKPQVVSAGGAIGGYVLKRIAADHVELAGPSGSLTLRPQFAATAASSTAPADSSVPAGPANGQAGSPILNPSSNPALMIEQNF